ncbi:MAG: hypothetical protein JEZ00_15780 [Anaerolineaceae bacterium]|nr:hypothetical protein [Anaerolineaceae bacterium]
MKRIRKFTLVLFLLCLTVGCTYPLQQSSSTPTLVEIETALPFVPTLMDTETPTSTVVPEIIQETQTEPAKPTTYTLDVLFDEQEKVLQINEKIDYLNLTGETFSNITLVIPANHDEGVFVLEQIAISDDEVVPVYTIDGVKLDLQLPENLQPDKQIHIELVYKIQLPETRGVLGYTERQINVCDWYAFIPPYDRESAWMVNEYHPIGEYLVYDVADFDVNIQLKEAKPDLMIIGSVPGQQSDSTWQFHAEQVRTFVWTASDQYQLLALDKTPNVVAYVFPEDVNAGWAALSTAISAWHLYSAVYGAPLQENLYLIEADFYDGMEYDGLFYLGFDYFERYNGGEKNYLTAISAHETAHQWWFAAVSNDAAKQPWLDESLAIYSELIFYETYYPGNEDWWWKFRVEPFKPTGWVDSTVYQYDTFRPYINAIYLRGAQFMDELRTTMGNEAFFAFLQAYYRAGSGKIMTRQDFFDLLAQYSDADFQPIINQYFSE